MKKMTACLVFLFLTTGSVLAQLAKTQTKTASKIQMWKPEYWAITAWQNVQANDNAYIKSKTVNGVNIGAIMFFNLGFTIPATATIQKIEANIIRLKNGKNNIYEHTVALLKHLNDTEACGGSTNMASQDPWTESEKNILYSFPADGKACGGEPFQWTPEEVNKPMFGLLLHPSVSSGGKGASVLIEQVTVTAYYTEQSISTKQSTSPALSDGSLDVKQYGNTFRINASKPGKYKVTVHDNFGRILQQTPLQDGRNETVLLNSNCKGYCIITVEGNGKKVSQRVFISPR